MRKHWKISLLIVAIAIGFASLYITDRLVADLSQEEQKKIELWSYAIKELSLFDLSTDSLVNFDLIQKILGDNTTVPVVLTNQRDSIIAHLNIPQRHLNSPNDLYKYLTSMQRSGNCIEVTLLDDEKNFVYFTESITLTRLTYYPYIQLVIIVLFIFVSYYAFSYSRRTEQNRVWVGMAKETAHQLGTPTSSLLAWIELLKNEEQKPPYTDNLEKDIQRLEKIVDRFSKIGTSPQLAQTNLVQLLSETVDYLQIRLSKEIELEKKFDPSVPLMLPLNDTLLEWVIENLVRNAADATQGEGVVSISIERNSNWAYVDITDNGKGIQRSQHKTVFKPGFTTKTRGWGLGLSLSKRIIEENHKGKLFVKHSEPDKGTTIRIQLRMQM